MDAEAAEPEAEEAAPELVLVLLAALVGAAFADDAPAAAAGAGVAPLLEVGFGAGLSAKPMVCAGSGTSAWVLQ